MKKTLIILFFAGTLVGMISCTSVTTVRTTNTNSSSGKVPPGQMKKATGSKSAKEFAPGQQKKKN